MTRLNNFPIFIFILLAIQLMFVGCNKSPDTPEVIIETNKLKKVVLTEELSIYNYFLVESMQVHHQQLGLLSLAC